MYLITDVPDEIVNTYAPNQEKLLEALNLDKLKSFKH